MNLYLAAPWVHRDMMPDLAARVEAAGHDITWKWWETADIPEDSDRDLELRNQAWNDLKGVINANVFLLFNTAKSEGKAVEQGLAIACEIPIIAIGKRGDGTSMNVFHYLDAYTWVPDLAIALTVLDDWAENGYQVGYSWGV